MKPVVFLTACLALVTTFGLLEVSSLISARITVLEGRVQALEAQLTDQPAPGPEVNDQVVLTSYRSSSQKALSMQDFESRIAALEARFANSWPGSNLSWDDRIMFVPNIANEYRHLAQREAGLTNLGYVRVSSFKGALESHQVSVDQELVLDPPDDTRYVSQWTDYVVHTDKLSGTFNGVRWVLDDLPPGSYIGFRIYDRSFDGIEDLVYEVLRNDVDNLVNPRGTEEDQVLVYGK